MAGGTTLLLDAAGDCRDSLAAPSLLPGWSRRHVLAHVAANATALVNLVRWAATGVPSPMYATPRDRVEGIERGLLLGDDDLLAGLARTAGELADAVDGLDPERWSAEVRTAQGRTVPASIVPWLRTREVYVHAVDLAVGPTFADVPADALAALCEDIAGKRSASGGPSIRLETTDAAGPYAVAGEGTPTLVTGSLAGITAYLTGRDARGVRTAGGPPPGLPSWL